MDEEHLESGQPSGSYWQRKPDCREAIDTLYHFLDGELTDDRRRDIKRHLDECAPCLEVFDFEVELKTVIARKCRDQVPDSLRDRVHQALMDASRMPPGFEEPPGMRPI